MKNKTYYIFIILLGLVLRVVSFIVYPVVFLLRRAVLEWALLHFFETSDRVFIMRKNYKKWKVYFHPYFWLFCFTTGLTNQWHGPEWHLKELKLKWFANGYQDIFNDDEIMDLYFNIIDRLRYFYFCYRWQALRNSHWAFNEWFFREGKWKPDTEKIEYCDPPIGSIYKYWDIMPQLKWDEGNDGGRELRFQTEDTPVEEIWLCTHLGKKKITFTTFKGNKRFMYAFCKVIYFCRLKLIIEHQFGWNYWNGIPILHFKHILRKK